MDIYDAHSYRRGSLCNYLMIKRKPSLLAMKAAYLPVNFVPSTPFPVVRSAAGANLIKLTLSVMARVLLQEKSAKSLYLFPYSVHFILVT